MAAAALSALSLPALGQSSPFIRGIDAVPVKPTPAALSGLMLEGARLDNPGTLHAALVLDASGGVMSLRYGSEKLGDLIPFRLDAHLQAAYQLSGRLELAADLPVTLFQWDNFQLLRDRGYDQPGVAAVGLGDLRLLSRYLVVDAEEGPLGLALAAVGEARLNIGDGDSFLGDRAMVVGARVAAERSFGKLRALGNLGVLLRPFAGQFLNLWVRNQVTAGVGGLYRLPDLGPLRQVDAFAEMNLATPLEAPFSIGAPDSLPSPWDVLVGARAKLPGPFRAELALGRGVALDSGYGRESFRVVAALRYVRGTQDRDGDGIPDGQDSCPDQPEDKDGFQDGDGCPDPDNDGDGVADPDDQCPEDPGPKALDGCPDRDQDDIPDVADKCPEQPGPAENEGCPTEEPEVVLEADRIRIKNNIFFETGEARIQPQSFPVLDEVYKVLRENPEVGPVRVEGHTDNRGSRPYNLDLSDRRAKAVMEYLIRKGIAPGRLKYQGFGFDRPKADNATPLGRAKNRRVEFNLLQDGEEEAQEELQETGVDVTAGQEAAPAPPGESRPDAGTPPGPRSGGPRR